MKDDQDYSDLVLEWEEPTDEERKIFSFWWSTGGTKRIVEGDNLVLIRVGSPRVLGQPRRGVVAYGVASSDNFQSDHWDPVRKAQGILANYVSMAPLNLAEDPIVTIQELKEKLPEVKKWAPQSSGPSIPDDIAERLIKLLDARTNLDLTFPPAFELEEIGARKVDEPALPEDVIKGYKEVSARYRMHQAKFRINTFTAAELVYGKACCCICKFEVPELLEAAHVIADSEGGEASVRNAILLCPTHHRALDKKFYTIDPDSWPKWKITLAEGRNHVGSVIIDLEEEVLE